MVMTHRILIRLAAFVVGGVAVAVATPGALAQRGTDVSRVPPPSAAAPTALPTKASPAEVPPAGALPPGVVPAGVIPGGFFFSDGPPADPARIPRCFDAPIPYPYPPCY